MFETTQEAKEIIGEMTLDRFSEAERCALNMAIEALKKQIPMRPEKVTDDGEIYKCPVCDETLFSSCEFQFCNVCGQALDWRDDK